MLSGAWAPIHSRTTALTAEVEETPRAFLSRSVLRTAVATAFADNEVGRLIEDFILQGGVDTALIKWRPYDGVGRTVRNGLNFTERGFGKDWRYPITSRYMPES